MSPLSDDMYCSEQIKVPPALPDILKQYTKAAIRTQPDDLLRWSAAYFGALARGQEAPVKQRFEPAATPRLQSTLTRQHLTSMHVQLGGRQQVTARDVCHLWTDLCQPRARFDELMVAGEFRLDQLDWLDFLALAAGTLCSDLRSTVRMTCEIVGVNDPELGEAAVPFATFEKIYRFLSRMQADVPESRVQFVLDFVAQQSGDGGEGLVVPRHFEVPECPHMNFP